ncbi:hypothetical protein K439DRAFT_1622795 [Ramaria rubella]|nr:hypothetical protein K439DRAFT_1622795 [Ramaria rubella]
MQIKSFERLSPHARTGTTLAIEMKRMGGNALPRLINMIKESDLDSKFALVNALNDVADHAIHTSRNLQLFSAAVDGGLDKKVSDLHHSVLSVNKVSIRMLESTGRSWMTWLSWTQVMNGDVLWKSIVRFEEMVDQLNMATTVCLDDLNRLHTQLNTVEDVARHERSIEVTNCRQLFYDIWTLAGGNRKRLLKHNDNILYLETALEYEEVARAHVVEVGFILDGISDGISELKKKFSRTIDPNDVLEVELHYEALVSGVRRLLELQAHRRQETKVQYKKVWIA